MFFKLDGRAVEAEPADTVASALLRSGVTTFTRSIKYHRPRGPFCLAGSCGQCLIRVDGAPSVMACRAAVHDGMQCERQNAPLGSADTDLLRAVDFVFPGGLDHHHIASFSKLAGQVALQVARTLAGLGHLPDRAQPAVPAKVREARLAVIGGGPAGLAAALAAAELHRDPVAGAGEVGPGSGVVLLERDGVVGGAALLGLDEAGASRQQISDLERDATAAGAELWLRSEVVGLYPPEEGQGDGRALLAVRGPEGLTAVRVERVVIAAGGHSQPAVFAGVDRPGVYAARGLLGLALRQGVLVGREARPAPSAGAAHGSAEARGPALAVLGEGRELELCAKALQAAGYQLAVVADVSTALRARGNPVREIQLSADGGAVRKVRCDAIAIALPPAPLHELGTGVGARAQFDSAAGGFPLEADADGRTSVHWLFAAGRTAGKAGEHAIASGRAAGRSAAEAPRG